MRKHGWIFTAGVLAWFALSGTEVHAHASLTGSAPADEAVVGEPPEEIVLTFSEPVRLTALTLEDQDGAPRPLDVLPADRAERFEVGARILAAGEYTVSWRVISADGHVITGDFSFTLSEAPAGAAADEAADAEETG